jgi:tRNA-2-methylthio-N6-dimethylallyladenosine synthase
VQVLCEGVSKTNEQRLSGRTPQNKIVVFEGSRRHHGQLLDVRVTRSSGFTLYGDAAIL